MPFLLNLILFQLCWIASVAGAGQGFWWAGPLAVLAFVVVEMKFSHRARADLKLLGVACVAGLLIDSAYVQLGLMRFASPVPSAELAPIWIIGMWASFALTLNHSLSFLKGRPLWSFVFGLVGGPFAYYVAARNFGATELTASPVMVYGALAVAWAIMTPALLALAVRWAPAPGSPTPAAQAAL